jgi:hypothetical protein
MRWKESGRVGVNFVDSWISRSLGNGLRGEWEGWGELEDVDN